MASRTNCIARQGEYLCPARIRLAAPLARKSRKLVFDPAKPDGPRRSVDFEG